MPPPVRRIAVDRDPYVAPPRPSGNGSAAAAPVASLSRAPRPVLSEVRERMRVENLWLAYGDNWAVRDVSLSVRQGEVLALIGPSGCGKTTLLRSLNRLTELTEAPGARARSRSTARTSTTLEDNELRRRVTMVFQQPNPFPMSIFDNVAFALREQSARPPAPARRSRSSRRSTTRCSAPASTRRSRGDLDRPALRLSGGQQQRLCIARAIAPQPEVLLMDEPCSALDPISTARSRT